MKYLKYILGVLAILIIAFLALGFFNPDLTYECEIVVDKPLAEAWAVTQDEDKMAEWLIGLQKVEHVSGEAGAIGAESDVYFNTDGQEMVIREKITDLVPNESISMLFMSDFMNMDYTLSMMPIDGKTKISTITTAVGNGMIFKSIMVLVGNSIKGQEETNLSHLKKTIEQNTKAY